MHWNDAGSLDFEGVIWVIFWEFLGWSFLDFLWVFFV